MSDKLIAQINEWKGVIAIAIAAGSFYGFHTKQVQELEGDIIELKVEIKELYKIQEVVFAIDKKIERISANQENIKESLKELKNK